jgi:glycerophosphoryl diester phosphodiesterase
VERTTDGQGRVDALTFKELEKLDGAFHFQSPDGSTPFRGAGVRVPALDELLAELPRAFIVFDAHTTHSRAAGELVALIERHAASHRVVIASDHAEVVEAARSLRPDWLYAATAPQVRARLLLQHLRLEWLARTPPCILMVPEHHGGRRVLSPRLVETAHRRKERVWHWVAHDLTDVQRVLDLGVDGFFTPSPSLVRQLAPSPS